MQQFEMRYAKLVDKILKHGEKKACRNGYTCSIFGESFEFDMSDKPEFPLLNGRRIYYKGILGELAAMLRGPSNVKDFELYGCNYWKDWADDEGNLNIDYGNLWSNWNGVNQLEELIEKLRKSPNDRRLLINTWKPDTIKDLSLPCCHYSYQWYVREGKYLDMIWIQRSVDTMIGLPSDIVLAAAWNIIIANQVGLTPGRIKMDLGDTHIYEEHIPKAKEYVTRVAFKVPPMAKPIYQLKMSKAMPITSFIPSNLVIDRYQPMEPINFLLKA